MKLSDVSGSSPTKLSDLTQSQEPSSSESGTDYLGMAGAAARGLASNVLGTVGDIQQAVNVPFNMAMRGVGLPQYQAGHWPTTGEFENILPGQKLGEEHPTAQTVGEWLPAAASLGYGAVKTAPKVAEAISQVLPGAAEKAATSLSKVGTVSDEGLIGEDMHNALVKRYDKLIATRAKQIDAVKKDYLSQPHNVERGIALSYRKVLSDYKKLSARDLTPEESNLIDNLIQRISGDPSMTRIESERRFLGKVASGQMRGYEAIRTQVAKDIKDKLENLIRSRIPAGGKFIDAYREMSEPINLFESTTGGRKIVSEASPYLKDTPKYSVEVLPREFFKDASSVRNLRKLSGGDQKFVYDTAKEYVATKLKGMSVEQGRSWIKAHDGMFREIGGDLRQQAMDYLSRVEKVEQTRQRAKKAVDAAAYGTAAATGGVTSYWILKHLLGM